MEIIRNCGDLQIIEFDPTDSNETIQGFIDRCVEGNEINQWWICMSGFNDDPRELIEIPEARQFCRRLIDLGVLIAARFPSLQNGKMTTFEHDAPGLNGFSLHSISNGSGRVKRDGKRVRISMDVDAVGFFSALLKTLKERKAPADIISSVENVIKIQGKFDPLRGSTKFSSDGFLDKIMQDQDKKWLSEGMPRQW